MHAIILALTLLPPAMPYVEPDVSLADLARFPDAATVDFWIGFSREYEQHCETAAAGNPWKHRADWWICAGEEAHRGRYSWETLKTARALSAAAYTRDDALRYLKYLRGEIGPERYWSGRLPDPVPFWRFVWMERHD